MAERAGTRSRRVRGKKEDKGTTSTPPGGESSTSSVRGLCISYSLLRKSDQSMEYFTKLELVELLKM